MFLDGSDKWMTDNRGESEIYRCLMTGLGSGPVIIKDRPAPRGVDEGQEMNIDEIHVPNISPTQCNAPQTTQPVETPPAWAVQLQQGVQKNEQTLEQVLQGVHKNEQTLKQVLEELQELKRRVSNLEWEVDRGVEAHSARQAGHAGSEGQEQGSYVGLNDSTPLPPGGVNVNEENDDPFMCIDDYVDTQVNS
ncbi:hypothetical protein ACJIZ3_023865 [Penstemon smallii]|uniref:Uncharacterized protein n=1 Tax=Penstemon smallii TaxID=265156 RepID=A0ABD3TQ84_9LAMI